jgi:uncharacterized membrane protein YphA (DoxX/SURF4 family)
MHLKGEIAMNVVLWVMQILLALVFGAFGTAKLTLPWEKLSERVGYVNDFPRSVIRLIGLLEVLGAVGVILPVLTGILPWLTPLAAGGLALVMVGAMLTHLRRHEYPTIGVNVVLLLLAIVVVYGRFNAV